VSRIRWYHFYFVLALFDLLVIMTSLQMHKATLGSAQRLVDAAFALDAQSDLVQRMQQRVVQLNAPGNDLFGASMPEEYDALLRRFRVAKANMNTLLERAGREGELFKQRDGSDWTKDLRRLREHVQGMEEEAQRLFNVFAPLAKESLSVDRREAVVDEAGPTMAKMDRLQHDALSTLGVLAQRNANFRLDLLQRHKDDLDQRYLSERLIIVLIIVILVGILAFGRRLQLADKALEEERRRLKEERKERLAAIGELCASVAHGIRNPLAAIRSSAQLALELGKMDDDSNGRLRDILNEGQRLGDRVTGLLRIAKSNQESFEDVVLNDVAAAAAGELRPEFERRGVQIQTEIDESPIVICGDRRFLEQVIVELLSNAMEQSKPGRAVYLITRRSADGMALIVVEDEGPGVPVKIRERVFDLFFTTKAGGTCIGLATVKRAARLHGGDVFIREGRKGGARFELLLPTIANRPGVCNQTKRLVETK